MIKITVTSNVDENLVSDEILKMHDIQSEKYLQQVKNHIKTFNDLIKVQDSSIPKLYRAIDRKIWLDALNGCDKAILRKVQNGLSKRAAIMFEEDLEVHKPEASEVKAAQDRILKEIIELADLDDLQIIGVDRPEFIC